MARQDIEGNSNSPHSKEKIPIHHLAKKKKNKNVKKEEEEKNYFGKKCRNLPKRAIFCRTPTLFIILPLLLFFLLVSSCFFFFVRCLGA